MFKPLGKPANIDNFEGNWWNTYVFSCFSLIKHTLTINILNKRVSRLTRFLTTRDKRATFKKYRYQSYLDRIPSRALLNGKSNIVDEKHASGRAEKYYLISLKLKFHWVNRAVWSGCSKIHFWVWIFSIWLVWMFYRQDGLFILISVRIIEFFTQRSSKIQLRSSCA